MTETKRLKIYPASQEQMREMIASERDAEMKKAYTEMLEGCLARPDQYVWYAVWMIELKDGTHIGDLCFKGFNGGVPEIGYGIVPEYRGEGYATEAVSAALRYAFSDPRVTAVEAETEEGNAASRRVLEKCGFIPNGQTGEEGPRFVLKRRAGDFKTETERLIIDGIRESDKEDYFFNISHDRKVLETFICRYAESIDELDITPYIENEKMFAIRLRETGRLIGIILYFDDRDGECEIGYGIGSRYWNRGYATEAVRAFIKYCFDKGFTTVYASFFTGNDASRRVMEKCGMTFSRFSEKELTYLGAERDLTYYCIRKNG